MPIPPPAIASCVLALAAATLRAAAPGVPPANLAPNPGLELDDAGQPAFWAPRTPTDDARTLRWDPDVRRSGARSLKIENRTATLSRWRTGHLRDFALEPGSQGLLSAWVRTDGAKGGAFLRFYCMTKNGRIAAQPQSSPLGGTRDWSQLRLPFTVPADCAYNMIYLELNGAGRAWFDDVELTGTADKPRAKIDLPPIAYAASELECLEGYAPAMRRDPPAVELSAGARRGKAQVVFWGESARYNVAVTVVDERGGRSSLRVLLNGKQAAQWRLDAAPASAKTKDAVRARVIRGLDVQRYSRIVFEAQADGKARCRIVKIAFTPTARFQGKLLPGSTLRPPPTLRVYAAHHEQQRARRMLYAYVNAKVAPLAQARSQALAKLASPEQWRERQRRTRGRLWEFFGDFGPKCPLNPRVVGRLDRPDYVIEKLVFESQPGYHCTANVCVPKRRAFPLPGVLITCGHAADGKAYHLYHQAALGLVLKGYVVLALDPTGQGERLEYFDPKTGKPLVPPCVSHHHYLARPSWLVGRSLAGYRTWDCIRAVDVLATRSEVDKEKLAVTGNSGGGIMALLITAADERIKVCAAAHPGGSMEQTYLTGQRLTEADLLSLIPPRPCLIIVGKDSREEPGHRVKLNDMLPFYNGLGVGAGRGRLVIVHGVHDMKQPKREAAYAWLNKWFSKESEGAKEPSLRVESVADLNCTKAGRVVQELGGETGQTLNAKLAAKLRPPRPLPEAGKALDELRAAVKAAVARRLGLSLPRDRTPPRSVPRGSLHTDDFTAEKLTLEAEPGIELPALLLVPKKAAPKKTVVLHVAELGKPVRLARPALALELVRAGHTVFSLDVRGSGETDPRDRATLRPLTRYDAQQFRFDGCAVRAARLGTTLLAMRARDVARAMDHLATRKELSGRPVVLVGEGLGGLWVLAAAAFDPRPACVVCVGTVPSYKLIVGSQYYRTRDCFWVPGALRDFDVPDLMALTAPRPTVLVDPADAMLRPLPQAEAEQVCRWPAGVYRALGARSGLRILRTAHGAPAEVAAAIAAALSP